MMMTARQSMMLQPRSSDTLRPILPTLRHAGNFSRFSGSSCFAWLLLAVCILVVSGESPTMTATRLEGQEMVAVDLDAGVTLVAGETRLAAHKAVLVARSPVFAKMLTHDNLESRSSEITIPDMEGLELRQLLALLYTGRAPKSPGMASQLMAAAQRYGVSIAMDPCEQQLTEQLTIDNAAAKALFAVRHNCCSLRQAVVAFIRANMYQVVATQRWTEAALSHRGAMTEIACQFVGPPIEISGQATAGIEAIPTTRNHTYDGWTSAAATAPSAHPHTTPLDDTAVSRSRAPATVGSEATNNDGWTSAAATLPSAVTHTLTTHDDAVLYSLRTPATVGSKATTTTRHLSDHGRTPAAATMPSPCHHTPPLDEAAVSRLRSLPRQEKGRRLLQAAYQGAVEEVRALLDGAAGADVGAKGDFQRTALHYTADGGHVEAARCLLQAGAEVDARDSVWQWTPLHVAAKRGNAAVVRLLLAASADPNAKHECGRTPLHYAARNGHTEAATALLEAGADRGARDCDGKTPLDLARWKNRQELIQMLNAQPRAVKDIK